MLGIYDGYPVYDIVYVDANGGFLQRHIGEHNGVGSSGEANKWDNLIDRVKTADELYQGVTPVKPSDGSFSYTFAGWVDAAGNPIEAVITDIIAYPSFTATPIGLTDAQAVAAAKAALTWDSIRNTNTSQSNVTANLASLPLTGANGTTIGWNSDKSAVVSNSGVVTRPAYGSGNAAVKLTATVTKGAALDMVVFYLTVTELVDATPPEVIISKNFHVLYVRRSGKITAQGATGYQSSDESVAVIDDQGNIFGRRPGTTVITVQTANGKKNISVTVKYSFVQWLLVIFAFGRLWLLPR